MPAPKTLETDRLLLRPWSESDAEQLYQHASHPETGRGAGWPAHTSVAESRQIIRDILIPDRSHALVLKETGLLVGSATLKSHRISNLTDRADECELGYWVATDYWGLGIATEAGNALLTHAFTDLGMCAVWCHSFLWNTRSQRVQEKLGFAPHSETPALDDSPASITTLLTRQRWEEKAKAHS
ncbi:GNAT family N-acetyltransferase [Dermabacteraceae bacterium P13103]